MGDKTFSFPFSVVIPTDDKKHPFFVQINFRPDIPYRQQPTEELINNGFAVLSFDYKDVTSDDNDFTNGLACNKFTYWFCENYKKYIDKENEMPFDQHYLVASIAPRKVLIGSASEDIWADPISEQLCCYAVSPAFEKEFVCPDRAALVVEEFFEGDIGYHLRKGLHYFSRDDWNKLIKFVNLHRNL